MRCSSESALGFVWANDRLIVDNEYSMMLKKFAGADSWKFYRDCMREWRWERTAPDGSVVGVSSGGFKTKADCEADARRMGWQG